MQLSPKDPLETVIITFDFSKLSGTITSAAFTVTRIDGAADSNPSAMLSGSASISGSQVKQKITGGVDGTSYKIYCLVDLADGQRLREEALMQVVSE